MRIRGLIEICGNEEAELRERLVVQAYASDGRHPIGLYVHQDAIAATGILLDRAIDHFGILSPGVLFVYDEDTATSLAADCTFVVASTNRFRRRLRDAGISSLTSRNALANVSLVPGQPYTATRSLQLSVAISNSHAGDRS